MQLDARTIKLLREWLARHPLTKKHYNESELNLLRRLVEFINGVGLEQPLTMERAFLYIKRRTDRAHKTRDRSSQHTAKRRDRAAANPAYPPRQIAEDNDDFVAYNSENEGINHDDVDVVLTVGQQRAITDFARQASNLLDNRTHNFPYNVVVQGNAMAASHAVPAHQWFREAYPRAMSLFCNRTGSHWQPERERTNWRAYLERPIARRHVRSTDVTPRCVNEEKEVNDAASGDLRTRAGNRAAETAADHVVHRHDAAVSADDPIEVVLVAPNYHAVYGAQPRTGADGMMFVPAVLCVSDGRHYEQLMERRDTRWLREREELEREEDRQREERACLQEEREEERRGNHHTRNSRGSRHSSSRGRL